MPKCQVPKRHGRGAQLSSAESAAPKRRRWNGAEFPPSVSLILYSDILNQKIKPTYQIELWSDKRNVFKLGELNWWRRRKIYYKYQDCSRRSPSAEYECFTHSTTGSITGEVRASPAHQLPRFSAYIILNQRFEPVKPQGVSHLATALYCGKNLKKTL